MSMRGGFVIVMLGIIAAALIVFGAAGVTVTDLQHLGEPRNAVEYYGETFEVPLPPATDGRVLPEVPNNGAGPYTFMTEQDGVPVLFDPCRPITYVVNPAGAPYRSDALLFAAIDRVQQATGLKFEFEGVTDEKPTVDRALIQPDRYGDRYVPMLIGWSNAQETPDLAGTVTGLGGSKSVPGAYGPQRYLAAGIVILDSEDIAALLASDRDERIASAVVMHEVAHVVGLGHVDDPTQIMNASNSLLTDWGEGDLTGLSIAGSGVCEDA